VGHFTILLFGAAIIAGQFASAQTGTAKPVTAAKAATAQLTDAQIEQAIRARFQKSKIRTENFTVSVRQGVATLGGKTDVIQRKGTATRLAKLAGARSVNNEIEISESARERASQNLAKGRRRAQVKRSEVSGR